MFKKSLVCIFSIALFACGGGGGSGSEPSVTSLDGSTAVKALSLSSGVTCPTGGLEVQSGIDDNNNSILDSDEIDKTEFLCNGAAGINGSNGLSATFLLADEPVGTNCINGGKKIQLGLDDNGNSLLDQGEIDTSSFVCNGTNGVDGTNGTNGVDGTNGIDGANSLFLTTQEASGTNCTNGGLKIQGGIDLNNNNILEPQEILASYTSYVCNGQNGTTAELSSLLLITDENIGTNCIYGGKKIESGIDNNGDTFLNANEIDSTQYICSEVVSFAKDEIIAKFDFNDNVMNIFDNTKRLISYEGVENYGESYFNSRHLILDKTYNYLIFDDIYYTDKASISLLTDGGLTIELSEYVKMNISSNSVQILVGSANSGINFYYSDKFPIDGLFHHVVVNFDSSIGIKDTVKLYIDGVVQNLTNYDGIDFIPGDKFSINKIQLTSNKTNIGELILKNGVFSEQEIIQMFESNFKLDTNTDDISFVSVNGDIPTTGGSPTLSFPIFNNSITDSSLTYSAICDQPWVKITPNTGSLLAGNSTNLTISAEATGLPVGTYNAKITISSPGQVGRIARVTLVVTTSP